MKLFKAILFAIRKLIASWFSTETLVEMSAEEHAQMLDRMVESAGTIGKAGGLIGDEVLKTGKELATAQQDLKRAIVIGEQLDQAAASDPANSAKQTKANQQHAIIGLAGQRVARLKNLVEVGQQRVADLGSKLESTRQMTLWQQYQNKLAEANNLAILGDEGYANAMEEVVRSQKMIAQIDQPISDELLQARSRQIRGRVHAAQAKSDVLTSLINANSGGDGLTTVDEDAAAAIAAARSNLGLPAKTDESAPDQAKTTGAS